MTANPLGDIGMTAARAISGNQLSRKCGGQDGDAISPTAGGAIATGIPTIGFNQRFIEFKGNVGDADSPEGGGVDNGDPIIGWSQGVLKFNVNGTSDTLLCADTRIGAVVLFPAGRNGTLRLSGWGLNAVTLFGSGGMDGAIPSIG